MKTKKYTSTELSETEIKEAIAKFVLEQYAIPAKLENCKVYIRNNVTTTGFGEAETDQNNYYAFIEIEHD